MQSRRKSMWVHLIAWEIPLLMLLGAGLRYWGDRPKVETPSLKLRLSEPHSGQVRIDWDRAAGPVLKGAAGRLDIRDGIERQEIPLGPENLLSGTYMFARAGDEIQVRLVVFAPDGTPTEEESGFLGQPLEQVSNWDELREARKNETDFEAQARWLRVKNGMLTARIQQLEGELRSLEKKLNIPEQK